MSALEQEIIEKFQQLQPAEKQRVRALIEQEMDSEARLPDASTFDFGAWAESIEALRQDTRSDNDGKLPAIDVVEMLREIRDGEDE
jgi:hypothetical protein